MTITDIKFAPTDQEWDSKQSYNFVPKVGDEVAVLRYGGYQHSVTFARVDRIGKRDLVLDDGSRYNLTKARSLGYGGWEPGSVRFLDNGYSTVIPTSHPKIVAVAADHKRRAAQAVLYTALRDVEEAAKPRTYGASTPSRTQLLALITAAERLVHILPADDKDN